MNFRCFYHRVRKGEDLQGNLPYFNNPKAYVKLYYANSIGEIDGSTKYGVIRIQDGGAYRYQTVDENFTMPPKP